MSINANTNEAMSCKQALAVLQDAIVKLVDDLEGVRSYQFSCEEYMRLYTIVYTLCLSNYVSREPQMLYDLYKRSLEDYISSMILSSLIEKNGESFLEKLVESWEKYKKLTHRLSKVFSYLERVFSLRKELKQTSFSLFHELVYSEVNDRVNNYVISMINEERDGKLINRAVVKRVIEICVEMDNGFEKDFQEFMLRSTSAFYSEKALLWIEKDSFKGYKRKVDMCMEQEKERVASYLPYMEKFKLPEMIGLELMVIQASKLEEEVLKNRAR